VHALERVPRLGRAGGRRPRRLGPQPAAPHSSNRTGSAAGSVFRNAHREWDRPLRAPLVERTRSWERQGALQRAHLPWQRRRHPEGDFRNPGKR
jgi:hypothetical protein